MSGVKKKSIILSIILVLFSLLAFGCRVNTPVESIGFNTDDVKGRKVCAES